MADRTPQTPRAVTTGTANWTNRALIPQWAMERLKGPGALYNLGNVIALLAGIGIAIRDVHSHTEAMSGIHHQLFGSAPAAWLTCSILIFIISGEFYHRAFHAAAEHRAGLNQSADLISGVAAIALTIALIGFGDTSVAIVAGVMLASGKLGSAILPALQLSHWGRALRLVVLMSRFPSILSLVLSVMATFQATGGLQDALLPLIMIGCFLLWLWADVILLHAEKTATRDDPA